MRFSKSMPLAFNERATVLMSCPCHRGKWSWLSILMGWVSVRALCCGGRVPHVAATTHLVVRQVRHLRPVLLVRRSEHLKDLVQLVDLAVAREQRSLVRHLAEDAPDAPHVHGRAVVLAPKQNLRCAVPQRDHLVRVSADGDAKCARKAKVRELQCVVIAIDEEVLRLQVAMEHAVAVAVRDAEQELLQVALHTPWCELARVVVHVPLQVEVEVLKHEVQRAVVVHDILELHNVGVLELLQQADLPDRRRRYTLVLVLQPDLLKRDERAVLAVPRLVHLGLGNRVGW